MHEYHRYKIISGTIFIAFSLTLIKLIQTTLFPDHRLVEKMLYSTPRGVIYDRKGKILASAAQTKSLFVRPAKIPVELREYLKNYFSLTGFYSKKELENLDNTNRNFVYLKRNMTPSVSKPAEKIIKLLKDEKYLTNDEIGLLTEEDRFYPYEFLSPIIGVLGRDKSGLYGVEYALNSKLAQGINVTLSLDADISRIAYEELSLAVLATKADSGSVGIIDITTREILSLVQVSSNNAPISISHVYEPGSVMKLFSAAFALEQGLASTTSPKFDDHNAYTVGNYMFSKPAYGYINLTEMLTRSANISFARLSSQFGRYDYHLWLTELGFGTKPNLPLTSIERGLLSQPETWSSLSMPMISIGQEIGVTTLQLLNAVSIIAGDGKATEPLLLKSLKDSNNMELLEISRTAHQLLHSQKSKELLYALENVVSSKNGTGKLAAVKGVRIAGKTGTGMIADSSGYSFRRNNTVFIGIVSVEDPRIAIVVALHHPKVSSSGGQTAAPVFADIVRRLLINKLI